MPEKVPEKAHENNDSNIYDLAIIGGGINGCGIARDAAGRGLKVFLCEQNDLGSGTSSASSKLIHGGLRYLEQYEFKLVKKALQEREKMLQAAPHLIKPIRFVLPHHPRLRSIWLIRMGLFLYDLIGGKRSLARSRWLKLHSHHRDATLKSEFTSGFEYADCWADDARLVIAVAQDAHRLGATISPQSQCHRITRAADFWEIQLHHKAGASTLRAKALVNATGPWVAQRAVANADNRWLAADKHRIKLVQGSHIVVKKWFTGEHAYILQNDDRRIVFVIPFQQDLAIIGTTETEYHGNPSSARITADETEYLCNAINQYFTRTLTSDDIIWSYSGVRPLYDNGADNLREVTRDYVVDFNARANLPPMVTIYGGKLTTFRCLAEAVLAQLVPYFPAIKPPWTADARLPGGSIPHTELDKTATVLGQSYPFLESSLLSRYLSAYGSETFNMLSAVTTIADMGQHFGHGLYQLEAKYLVEYEWATSSEDILWRRSKLGLKFDQAQVDALDRWLVSECGSSAIRAPHNTPKYQPVCQLGQYDKNGH